MTCRYFEIILPRSNVNMGSSLKASDSSKSNLGESALNVEIGPGSSESESEICNFSVILSRRAPIVAIYTPPSRFAELKAARPIKALPKSFNEMPLFINGAQEKMIFR